MPVVPVAAIVALSCIASMLPMLVNLTAPKPFGVKSIPTFESPPVPESVGLLVVAAFAKVNSLTAEPVAVTFNSSFPPVSNIAVPTAGDVKVLFVKV